MCPYFQIEFDYPIDKDRRNIHLMANVQVDASGTYYIVKDIQTVSGAPAMPTRIIKKLNAQWVHVESERSTPLSTIIGKIIDEKLKE